MKKKITDFMDDLPEEEVERLLSETAGRKKRSRKHSVLRIAAAAACIALLGGGAVYAAYGAPGFLREYLGITGNEKAKIEIDEEKKTAENDDYRLTVEEVTGDEQIQMIFVSLEPKTDEAKNYLQERQTARPVVTVDGKEPEGWSFKKMTELISGEEAGTGKEYYLFTLEDSPGTCDVSFGEGLKAVDVEYDTGWAEEHRDEIVSLNFELENMASETIVITPGELSEGISYDQIEIGHFSVRGEGTRANEKRVEISMPVPTVSVVTSDGQEHVLQPGNMDGDPHAFVAASGGTMTSMDPESEEIRFQSVLTGYVDLEDVEEVRVNGERFLIER